MDVGSSHRVSTRQQEIEEEIQQVSNQPAPNVQDQESFPTLGGKKGTSLGGGGGGSAPKTKATTSYRHG